MTSLSHGSTPVGMQAELEDYLLAGARDLPLSSQRPSGAADGNPNSDSYGNQANSITATKSVRDATTSNTSDSHAPYSSDASIVPSGDFGDSVPTFSPDDLWCSPRAKGGSEHPPRCPRCGFDLSSSSDPESSSL